VLASSPPPQPLAPRERLARLRLARTPRVGPATFHALLDACGSAVAGVAALPTLARRGGRQLLAASEAVVQAELGRAERLGARVIVWGEPDYPPLLAATADAPIALTCLGDNARLSGRCVAVVGARNASVNGQRFAQDLARDLAAAGLVVVSGLARGIDTAAHRGAGPAATVGVQAGGVDVVYPPENAALHAAIVAGGGAVVAEMPIGLQPQALHFPRRNRIISGLAHAVVVVEATARSGSLITARAALDQGREVLAVPGFPLDPRAAGPNGLIRDGARLLASADDVLAALAEFGAPAARASAAPAPPVPERNILQDQSDHARQAVLAGLGVQPTAVDELVRRCHLSAPVAQMVLLELELAGRLQRHPGNQVSLVI
jgi:DNA processing protein